MKNVLASVDWKRGEQKPAAFRAHQSSASGLSAARPRATDSGRTSGTQQLGDPRAYGPEPSSWESRRKKGADAITSAQGHQRQPPAFFAVRGPGPARPTQRRPRARSRSPRIQTLPDCQIARPNRAKTRAPYAVAPRKQKPREPSTLAHRPPPRPEQFARDHHRHFDRAPGPP